MTHTCLMMKHVIELPVAQVLKEQMNSMQLHQLCNGTRLLEKPDTFALPLVALLHNGLLRSSRLARVLFSYGIVYSTKLWSRQSVSV